MLFRWNFIRMRVELRKIRGLVKWLNYGKGVASARWMVFLCKWAGLGWLWRITHTLNSRRASATIGNTPMCPSQGTNTAFRLECYVGLFLRQWQCSSPSSIVVNVVDSPSKLRYIYKFSVPLVLKWKQVKHPFRGIHMHTFLRICM